MVEHRVPLVITTSRDGNILGPIRHLIDTMLFNYSFVED